MPNVSQYDFTLREVAVALIKTAGITEGKWSFGVNFGINIGNFGPTQDQSLPSIMAQIQSFNLAKAPPDSEEGGTIIDASKL